MACPEYQETINAFLALVATGVCVIVAVAAASIAVLLAPRQQQSGPVSNASVIQNFPPPQPSNPLDGVAYIVEDGEDDEEEDPDYLTPSSSSGDEEVGEDDEQPTEDEKEGGEATEDGGGEHPAD